MYANQTRETYTSTVYQAQGMVAVQADCIMERALALMIDTAHAAEVTLEQLAAQIIDRRVKFDSPN